MNRVELWQGGRPIGTMAPDFNPRRIKSKSMFYDPRPGDFTFADGHWIAAPMLGGGDLESVPGFQWGPESARTPEAVARDQEADRRAVMDVLTGRAR